MLEVKTRGRKKLTEEEKIAAKLARDEAKANKTADNDIFEILSELNKSIKKSVTKLSSKEIEKLKSSLINSAESITIIFEEKQKKEKDELQQKTIREIAELSKKIEQLKTQL